MGHFTIELPESKKGDVKRFDIKKVEFCDTYDLESLEQISESGPKFTMMGFKYVVTISTGESNTEYCLFKSENGEWFKDYEGKTQLDNSFLVLLKNAIIKRENEINSH